MSYPKKLLRLQPKRGFIRDTADHEASEEFWTVCDNVQFRDGFATRLAGYRPGYKDEIGNIAPVEMYHAVNSLFTGLNWWLLFQASGTAHAIQAGTEVQIDGGLLSVVNEPWEYSSSLLNGLPIISNSRDEPVYWSGSGNVQVLPGWPAGDSCRFIAVLKFHIFAFNISGPGGSFEQLVRWSSATEPGSVPQEWTPTTENDAGSLELADSPGAILCAYPLGDALYIYKRTATYQIRYVGGQNVFSVRKVQSSSGALTPRSVCDVGGAHFIVNDGDLILNDGTTRRSVGESRVKDWLFELLDVDEFFQLSCTYNRAEDEVVIAFPSNGSTYCDTALVYDLSRDSFGVRSLAQVTHLPVGLVQDSVPANTWANRTEPWIVASDVWAAALGSSAVDSLITLKATEFTVEDVNNGIEFGATIGRTGLTFGEPERIKFVKKVHVRTREPFGELFVRVGGSMQPNSAITWSDEVTLSDTEQIANCFAVGRYIGVEIRSADGVIWKVTGVDLEAELRGYY
jgi:hypothetical protein